VSAAEGDTGWHRTRGPHFLVAPGAIAGDVAVLTGDDAHHLAVVLRAAPGAPVSLADATGVLYQARIATAAPAQVRLAIVGRHEMPAPSPTLTVVHALPKGRKLDEVVQRLTEVGVDRLVPVHSARSQVRLDPARAAKAVARWRAVAHAAGKQSRRTRPLDIAEVGEWASAFDGSVRGAVLWEEGGEPLRSLVAAAAGADKLVLAIGPEGGLTRTEVAATGLPIGSLGPTILRTETAALVACSVALAVSGRLDAR
jgi:16S rRNA (uracil1498-N3)-methyltransferase